MKKFLFSRSLIGLGVLIGTFAALPLGIASARASASKDCPGEQFSQPFLSWGDNGFYALAPGESPDNFDGTGWTLTGGASIVSATLVDGTTGLVLDLPAGSTAVSPPMCVSTGFRKGRMLARVVAPAAGNTKLTKPDVTFTTTPADGIGPESHLRLTPDGGWDLTHKVKVAPGATGPEQAYFSFTSAPDSSELQVYNLYVDPRMLR